MSKDGTALDAQQIVGVCLFTLHLSIRVCPIFKLLEPSRAALRNIFRLAEVCPVRPRRGTTPELSRLV